jgi:hypothetical protein
MRLTLGSRGLGRHARRRPRLFATATIAACLGLVVVSATGVQNIDGATNKAATLPLVPVCGFNLSSQYAPSAGDTVTYTLSFAICKTLTLTVELVRPAAVKKAVGNKPTKPTRYKHGNPVWVKHVSWRDYPTKTLHLTFANNLHTGQKVELKVIFSAHGYRSDVEITTQTVYNPRG